MTPIEIAKVCHTVLREYSSVMHGDNTEPEWKDITDEQRDIEVHNVQYVIDNPDDKPHLLHENWLREKAVQGWSYGPERNLAMRQDPRFNHWSELPVELRMKDHIFSAIVHAMSDDVLEKTKDEKTEAPSPDQPIRRGPKRKKEKKED